MAARRVDVQGLIAEEHRDGLRPAKAEFIAPMLATLTTSYSDTGWLLERKLDGRGPDPLTPDWAPSDPRVEGVVGGFVLTR